MTVSAAVCALSAFLWSSISCFLVLIFVAILVDIALRDSKACSDYSAESRSSSLSPSLRALCSMIVSLRCHSAVSWFPMLLLYLWLLHFMLKKIFSSQIALIACGHHSAVFFPSTLLLSLSALHSMMVSAAVKNRSNVQIVHDRLQILACFCLLVNDAVSCSTAQLD